MRRIGENIQGRIIRSTADPRSRDLSGIPGKNKVDVESMDPAENKGLMESWKTVSDQTEK